MGRPARADDFAFQARQPNMVQDTQAVWNLASSVDMVALEPAAVTPVYNGSYQIGANAMMLVMFAISFLSWSSFSNYWVTWYWNKLCHHLKRFLVIVNGLLK